MHDRQSCTYVLVYKDMDEYGGIQSILIRLSEFLSKKGYPVILANVQGRLLQSEKLNADIIPFKEKNAHLNISRIVASRSGINVNVISFDPASAAVGLMTSIVLSNKFDKQVKFGVGVFHPRDFFREQEKKHMHVLNFLLARVLREGQVFFMNGACKKSHERFFRRSMSKSIITPVPLDHRSKRWKPNLDYPIKICSVGRVVPFKAYNFSAPEILKSIQTKGFAVTWDVYGHGTHEEELVRSIEKSGVEKFNFRGQLPLARFDEIVSEYDVFVGMGTAAVQAAQLGVPTIVAMDQEENRTYGYLSQVPFGNVGEIEEKIPTKNIEDELIKYLKMSSEERVELSKSCWAAASKYDVDSFVSSLDYLPEIKKGFFEVVSISYCGFYSWINSDNLLRKCYRIFTKRSKTAKEYK